MNKMQLEAKVRTFCLANNLSLGEVVVGYGGAMVLLGLRQETSDIDLDIRPQALDWIKRNNPTWEVSEGLLGECLDFPNGISIHPTETTCTVRSGGIALYSPGYLLKCYKVFQSHPKRKEHKRAQDAESIRLLEEYIASRTKLTK